MDGLRSELGSQSEGDFDGLDHLYHRPQLSILLYPPAFLSSLLLSHKYLHPSLNIWPNSSCHSFHSHLVFIFQ